MKPIRAHTNLESDASTPRGVSAVGDRIREARVSLGYSQSELARMTGVAQTTISMIEVGERDGNAHTRNILARALGIRAVELFVLAGDLPRMVLKGEA